MDDVSALLAESAEVGVPLEGRAAEAMLAWLELVEAATINVSGIRDRVEARRKHLVDSVACLPVARLLDGERCLDLGSGGGFPGVPVAICRPGVHVDLVDATGKKVQFLNAAIAALGLQNVRAIQARAEVLARHAAWRERVDCVFGRAVAPLRVLVEYALPFCRPGGRLVALKGARAANEMVAAEMAVSVLGGVFGERRAFDLPGGGGRVVVRIDKIRPTPAAFPRGTGIPARRPL